MLASGSLDRGARENRVKARGLTTHAHCAGLLRARAHKRVAFLRRLRLDRLSDADGPSNRGICFLIFMHRGTGGPSVECSKIPLQSLPESQTGRSFVSKVPDQR